MNETEQKTEQTPYSAWLQTEILHTLQQTVSDHPGEYAFLINAQVQELYWALIVKEMQAAQAWLREDNLVEAHDALLRVVGHHEPLNATWRSLSWITPSDLMPILAAVRATYGRDTALQGWTYRHMVYLFGIKQEQHLEHFEPQPHRFEQLQKALNEPSLYYDVLAFLSRRGFKIPAEVLRSYWERPWKAFQSSRLAHDLGFPFRVGQSDHERSRRRIDRSRPIDLWR
jgi:tryptophan 2,3-dioxygenase